MDQWVTPSILSMFEPPYCRLKRRPGGEVMLDDLAPGRTPHALVAQDVGERLVERADPVRHADDERMQENVPSRPRSSASGAMRWSSRALLWLCPMHAQPSARASSMIWG